MMALAASKLIQQEEAGVKIDFYLEQFPNLAHVRAVWG